MITEKEKYTGMEIAIIGMVGKYPGASNLFEFWENLKKGVDSITFFSEKELLETGIDPELIKKPNYVKAKGILKDPECFDYKFFGYSNRDAQIMDPQSRLLHECCYSALDDACYNSENYTGSIGLFIGASTNLHWQAMTFLENINQNVALDFETNQLTEKDEINLRISYNLNLKGPSIFVKTACSTSLTTVHLACRSLLLGECNMALAGGVSMTSPIKQGYLFQEGFVRSSDGHCRAFDEKADGFVVGTGVGMVLLKPLQNAIKDKDNIYAVIKGSALNNDGKRRIGYTAPSVEGQNEVIQQAHQMSQVDPESISFIETHGSGTALGDPIEIEALKKAISSEKKKTCAIGSVKTNIGHLDAAAGIASLTKAVLALKNKQIPPNVHFNKPNPRLNLQDTPFYINNELIEWPTNSRRRAAVNSLGMGGSNVHLILEEVPPRENTKNEDWHQLIFSAKTESSLNNYKNNLSSFLEKSKDSSLYDIEYSLKIGRGVFNHRCFVLGQDTNSLTSILRESNERKLYKNFFQSKPKVVFMFPGQGVQYFKMGEQLYFKHKVFREQFDICASFIKRYYSIDILSVIIGNSNINQSILLDTSLAQPLIFSFEYALAKLLIQCGIVPDYMIGYSFGEYVAACLSGVFSLEDALKLVVLRGKLMKDAPKGKMISVPLPENELKTILPVGLNIAINNDDSCIIAGGEHLLNNFELILKEKKIIYFPLDLTHAGHSPSMDSVLEKFELEIQNIAFDKLKIPFISNVTGKEITNEQAMSTRYWVNHLRDTVRFAEGIKSILKDENVILLEVGPGRGLNALVNRFIKMEKRQRVINVSRQFSDKFSDNYYFLKALGLIWLYGVDVNWLAYYSEKKGNKVSLPHYAFDKFKLPVSKPIVTNHLQLHDIKAKNSAIDERIVSDSITITNNVNLRPTLSSEYVAPSTKTEETIIQVWQNVFGLDNVGVEDDFFELGGDSLKAVAIVSKVQSTFDTSISIQDFFKIPTIKHLAHLVKNGSKKIYSQITTSDKRDYYPLSNTEKRMFVMDQFDRSSINYNVAKALSIKGNFDPKKFIHAINKLVDRHEVLRSSYHVVDGKFVKKIHDQVDFIVPVVNVSIEEVQKQIDEFVVPYNLGIAPLFRLKILEINKAEYILLTDFHHIILDGYGGNIFSADFLKLYCNEELEPLKLQYKDYAIWQQEFADKGVFSNQEKFWLDMYKTKVSELNLFTDYPRPSVITTQGESLYIPIDNEFKAQIEKISLECKATRFMTMLTAYYILLSKYTQVNDIVVGSSVEGRALKDMQNVGGAFIGTVALRSQINKHATFKSHLLQIKELILNSYNNSDYQLDELLEKLNLKHDPSKNPLFDTMFIAAVGREKNTLIQFEDFTIESYPLANRGSKVDLLFEIIPDGNNIMLEIQYATRLYKKSSVEKIKDNYFYILKQVCQNPEIIIDDIKLEYKISKATTVVPNFEF